MEVIIAVVCVGVCGSLAACRRLVTMKGCGCHLSVSNKENMSKDEWTRYFNDGGGI